ncbi:MAG: hypothetical protein GXP02_00585, partial [Alphaproteobacteria bacterium]|nr:hypothetical protein [Alphaproteobacteria bacterium]
MTASINKNIAPFTGKKALMWVVGFFIVIFIINGLMVFFALSTFGGLETRNPYFKGLYYNRQLAAAAAQEKSGWKISLNHIPATLKGDRLTVRIS